MALTNRYVIADHTVSHHQPGKVVVSVKINHIVEDEGGATLRTYTFRAEWLDNVKLQKRANSRGANKGNGLSWSHVDIEDAVKEWLTEKRYFDPTNVTTLVVAPPPTLPPGI